MTEKNQEQIMTATPDPILMFTAAAERLRSTIRSSFEEMRNVMRDELKKELQKLKTEIHEACEEIIHKIYENDDVPIEKSPVPQSTVPIQTPIQTPRSILAPEEIDCGKDIVLSSIPSAPGKSVILHDRHYNSVGLVTGGKLSNSSPQANHVWKPKGFLSGETEHSWSRILPLSFKEQRMIVVHCFEEHKLYDGFVDVPTYRVIGIYACDLAVFDPGGTYRVRHCVKSVPSIGNRLNGSRQGLGMGLQQLSAKLGIWADYMVKMNAGVFWTKLTWIIGSGDSKTVEAIEITDNFDGTTFMFLDGLDVDRTTDVVYFTSLSSRFRSTEMLIASGIKEANGILVKYDPSTKSVSVLMESVSGAIGYAVTSDCSWVLGSKFVKSNINRYWIMLGDTFVEKTKIKFPCRESVEVRSDFGNCLMLNFIFSTIVECERKVWKLQIEKPKRIVSLSETTGAAMEQDEIMELWSKQGCKEIGSTRELDQGPSKLHEACH